MYEFTSDENYDFRILNDCEFTVSEKSDIQTTEQCFFGNDTETYFDKKILKIGNETFKLFEFVGNYTLIDENLEYTAAISMDNGAYTWTQNGISCSLTPASGSFTVDEGCELEWEEAKFYYNWAPIEIEGPDGLIFRSYDASYERYYEIEYL